MHHSTNAPTQTEIQRFAEFEWMGCVIARVYFRTYAAYDIHHLLDGGVRRGHMHTIPLQPWYHRGLPPDGHTIASATIRFGPSMEHNKDAFVSRFGSELVLLEMVNEMIATKRKVHQSVGRRGEVPQPVIVSQWTIVGDVAVKTRSMSIAQRVARQRTDTKSGTVDGIEWLDISEYNERTR